MLLRLLVIGVAIAGGWGCDPAADSPRSEGSELLPSTTIPNTPEQVKNDMALPHEAIPRGVPESMDWRTAPRAAYGNQPPEDWSAMTTWGQVYAATGHQSPPNTRVQIKDMQTWYLSKASGQWTNWQRSSEVGGANYSEDFQNDVNQPADIRKEAEGYSATVPDGVNFHFWPQEGRVEMNPTDIEAVWTAIDARLVLDDSTRTDDRADARLMMSAGADYWLDRTAAWDQWTTNGDIAIGRFRFITPDWQTYNMHTISDSIFATNPPPVN
jgi:hypothetical protein